MEPIDVRVGTAGWRLARIDPGAGGEGSHLERYARLFSCVEINSSFYRPHRPATYARWAASVPATFRFSLKIPKEITHVRRLVDAGDMLERFLDESASLAEKRAVLLVQLPPSFAYDAAVADAFFVALRDRYDGYVVCEPRHPTWFTPDVDRRLQELRIARVAADPAPAPEAAAPGGWSGFAYVRLHGSPRTYYSAYEGAALDEYARRLRTSSAPSWCIFDNTAFGEATPNALELQRLVRTS
jgi:uncharacterized protein YecE (DUF72 family)